MSVDRLREAILSKAREEAEKIIHEAEERARAIIEEAERKRRQEVEERRKRLKLEIGYDEKIASAIIESRHAIAKVKKRIFEELKNRVLEKLKTLPTEIRYRSLKQLLKEVLDSGVITQRMRIYVSREDIGLMHRVVEELGITERVIEITPIDIVGGVIVESEDGSLRVDNSFETRLENVLRIRAPEINKKLFG